MDAKKATLALSGIILLIILILLLRNTFVNKQEVNAPKQEAMPSTTPAPTTGSNNSKLTITSPAQNSTLHSPLTVKGTVPPGWVFEGVFPIKLVDENNNVISQTQGREVTPGSWSSGNSIDFTATLNFSTSAKSGSIVLEKDNPSGLPANSASFQVPVNF